MTMGDDIMSRMVALSEVMAAEGAGELAVMVGLYAGLLLGTMQPDRALTARLAIEQTMGRAMGVPPEQVESHFRGML